MEREDWLPYWSRAESRNSQGEILNTPKRTGHSSVMTFLYDACLAISGQAVIYYLRKLSLISQNEERQRNAVRTVKGRRERREIQQKGRGITGE